MQEGYLALGDQLAEEQLEFLQANATSDISLQRMRNLAAEIKNIEAEKEKRGMANLQKVVRIQELWRQMDMIKTEACKSEIESVVWNDGPTKVGVSSSVIKVMSIFLLG